MPVPAPAHDEFHRLLVLPLERPRTLLAQVQAACGAAPDPSVHQALALAAALLESVDRKTSPLYERQIQAAARFALARAPGSAEAGALALAVAVAVARGTQRSDLVAAATR